MAAIWWLPSCWADASGLSPVALLVDYVLTITVSIAAAGDAIFGLTGPWSLLGLPAHETKLVCEAAIILLLIMLNLRG